MTETKVLRFYVKGSQPEPYEVIFYKKGNNFTALCTCPAGVIGTYCKHRFSLISGDINGLVSNNQDEVYILSEWLKETDVESALNAVNEAEKIVEKAKKDLSARKKALARAMNN